jgi:hypothetical protein
MAGNEHLCPNRKLAVETTVVRLLGLMELWSADHPIAINSQVVSFGPISNFTITGQQ